MLSDEVREVASQIGQFYLQKNDYDYAATEKEITSLRVTTLEIKEGKVVITLARPGLIIGRKGENIGNLAKFLNRKIHIVEDQDPLYYWLVPSPFDLL